jgi:hypothetical protein
MPYLGVTVHYIDRQMWTLRHTLLVFRHFPGSHSAEQLSKFTSNVLKEWGIDGTSIRTITSDSDATNLASFRVLENDLPGFMAKDSTIRCMAHAMNLAAQAILRVLRADRDEFQQKDEHLVRDQSDEGARSEADIAAIFRVARKIILKTSFSHLREEALRQYCHAEQIPALELIRDVGTRFVSTALNFQTAGQDAYTDTGGILRGQCLIVCRTCDPLLICSHSVILYCNSSPCS